MRSATLLATLAFAFVTTSTPIEQAAPVASKAAARHLTAGIPTRNNGHPYIRQEINDLKNQTPKQWSLYLLGLQAFQGMDQSDPLSYYQISGIHGRPYKVWQDAQGIPNPPGLGYCPHSNVMFSTWHRPYLALFEQEMYKQVRNIADKASSNRTQWTTAADAFRIPYWDWALGEQGGDLPEFFTTQTISIDAPDGVVRTIQNPLYSYTFKTLIPGDFEGKWAQINSTVRWPTSNEPSAPSQPLKVKSFFSEQRNGYHDSVAGAFLSQTSFNDFANAVESAHGGIHECIGGDNPADGHMWPIDYAGFDPIFWLHHTNVDRLFAIYQVLHPDLWITSGSSGWGNFWLPANTGLDLNAGLQPFWKNNETFWKSDDVRDTAVFGYAYPEEQSWNYGSKQAWQAAVSSTVAKKYSGTARAILAQTGTTGSSDTASLLTNNTFTDWTIRTTASAAEMPPTFRMVFSLPGGSSEGNSEVGRWLNLMPSTHNDQKHKTKRASTLHFILNNDATITSSLIDLVYAGKLESLDPSVVVPYLKEHLTWSIIGADGAQIKSEDLTSLFIDFVSAPVRIPDEPSQPLEYTGEATLHSED